MRLLVFGRDGQVGRALQPALAPLGDVVALGRSEADLAVPETLGALIDRLQPAVIVNAAAYTAVDAAEDDRAAAWRVNAEAVGAIGAAARKNGALVVHYSTDYVYAGAGSEHQDEVAPTSPMSVYGASKLTGEMLLRESGADAIILRTSWVYAAEGKNFPLTILRLARERERLDVVADQVGAPTSAALLAAITARIVPQARGRLGTYNLAPQGETSWHGLAQFLVTEAIGAGARLRLRPDAIRAIATSQYPTRAVRPANSRLDTTKLRTAFGLDLPPWQDGIRQLIKTLAGEGRL